MTTQIHLPIRALLKFYDDPEKAYKGHVSAITGIIGEELGTGLLIDYYLRQGLDAKVVKGSVTQGTNIGKRLDRWLVVNHGRRATYYQVEIKNWGAYAIGGRRIAVDADASILRKHKIERWSKEWNDKGFIKEAVQKVLTPMRPPVDGVKVEPLVCFWDAMHPTGSVSPLFSIPIHSSSFTRVWIFSMSSYLRNLLRSGEQSVAMDVPAIKFRLQVLKELLGK